MEGVERLVVQVLYGGGLRIAECLRLRVKDIDFELNQTVIYDGKGQKSWLVRWCPPMIRAMAATATFD